MPFRDAQMIRHHSVEVFGSRSESVEAITLLLRCCGSLNSSLTDWYENRHDNSQLERSFLTKVVIKKKGPERPFSVRIQIVLNQQALVTVESR